MDRHISTWQLLVIGAAITGCTPQIGYKALAERDAATGNLQPALATPSNADTPKTISIANPADGEFIYGIGRSSILLPPPVKQAGKEDATSECSPVVSAAAGTYSWSDCLRSTTPQVVAASSPDYVYAIRPVGGLYAKEIGNSDPALTQSISFGYENPVTKAISDTGPVVAAAYSVGGAPLAGAAVLLIQANKYREHQRITEYARKRLGLTNAEIEELFQSDSAAEAKRILDTFIGSDTICAPTRKSLEKSSQVLPTIQRLYLPASLKDNTERLQVATGKRSQGCWEMFPQNDGSYSNRGWFYRIVDVPPPAPPVAFPPTHLAGNPIEPPFIARSRLIAGSHNFLAVPACRAVKLQITWWENFDTKTFPLMPGKYTEYPLSIADTNVLQMLSVTKSERKISLLGCGGYATAVKGPSQDDATGAALIKQVKDIHVSEQGYEKER